MYALWLQASVWRCKLYDLWFLASMWTSVKRLEDGEQLFVQVALARLSTALTLCVLRECRNRTSGTT